MAPSSASSVVAVSAIKPPASAGPAEVASAKAGVVETEAATLKRLGGKYLCDQRIYPQGGGGHISAWEWAFEVAPDELAGQLARELPGSEREERMFRFKGESGQVDVVVSVEGADKSKLGCQTIPSGTKSLVVASRW